MYFKKTIFKYLILLTVIILTYVGYLCFNIYSIDYEKINHDTIEKIIVNLNKCKGETPNLQTDSIMARWTDEAHNIHKEMMDKVLESLTILGESKKGKPNRAIFVSNDRNHRFRYAKNKRQRLCGADISCGCSNG